MGKKRHTARTVEDIDNDKPDFAADLFHTPKKPKTTKVEAGTATTEQQLRDRLKQSTLDKLSQLKAQIQQVEEQVKQAPEPAAKRSKPFVRSARTDSPEKDLSFAELFDPQEEDEKSFEELLKTSKQDWKEYK